MGNNMRTFISERHVFSGLNRDLIREIHEAFMSGLRIPCDSITEVEVLIEGKGDIGDWKQAA